MLMKATHNFIFGRLSALLKENKLEPIRNKLSLMYEEKFFICERTTYLEREKQGLKYRAE